MTRENGSKRGGDSAQLAAQVRPARGYSWPPFEPGNKAALRHGAYSPSVIEAKAAEFRERLFDVCPWIDPDRDVVAVARFLRAEARALMLHQLILDISAERGAEKVPVRTWEQAAAADRLAAQLGNVLGLDPTGRARLQQTVASTEATLADLKDQGRAIVARRNQQRDVGQ